jgi:hypothetical protein
MRKLIITAAAIAGLGFIPATANAAPFLSISRGKAEARSFEREVVAGMDDVISSGAKGCYRIGRSSVECTTWIKLTDMRCESTTRATMTWSGWVRVHTLKGSTYCF